MRAVLPLFMCALVVCLSVISLADAVLPVGDLHLREIDDGHYRRDRHDDNFVNELDIFYPMRKAYFDDKFDDQLGNQLGNQLDQPDDQFKNFQSPNELTELTELTELNDGHKLRDAPRLRMRGGVGAMMDRLLSIRRLPDAGHYKE